MSRDSLPCKAPHNWSPSVYSCICKANYNVCYNLKFTLLSTFVMLKTWWCRNSAWIVHGLWPKCNDWRNCKTNGHCEERSELPTICSELWSRSKCCFTISKLLCEFSQMFHCFLQVYYDYARLSEALHSMGSENAHMQRIWQWISDSYHTSNRWWNRAFICERWNQRAVKAVDAYIFTKEAE
jgi:hypothetical protein